MILASIEMPSRITLRVIHSPTAKKPLHRTSEKRWMNYRVELAELASVIGIKTQALVTISGQKSILT
jgi:hypothetical protein